MDTIIRAYWICWDNFDGTEGEQLIKTRTEADKAFDALAVPYKKMVACYNDHDEDIKVLKMSEETIAKAKQLEMKSWYEYDIDGEHVVHDMSDWDLWPFFRRVAAEIAMSDCSEVHVTKIVFNRTAYEYAGWKPGMEFEFLNIDDPDGESYTTWMEHLDH